MENKYTVSYYNQEKISLREQVNASYDVRIGEVRQ